MLTQAERIETEETLARLLRKEMSDRGIDGTVRVRWGPDPTSTIQIDHRRVRMALWSYAPSRATWATWVADIVTHCLGVQPSQARAA